MAKQRLTKAIHEQEIRKLNRKIEVLTDALHCARSSPCDAQAIDPKGFEGAWRVTWQAWFWKDREDRDQVLVVETNECDPDFIKVFTLGSIFLGKHKVPEALMQLAVEINGRKPEVER